MKRFIVYSLMSYLFAQIDYEIEIQPISAGLYIHIIQAGEFSQTRKMIMLK